MILGIDPGQTGGFVFLTEEGKIEAAAFMPINTDGLVSYLEVKKILGRFKDDVNMVLLERAVSFGMGGKSAFNYGQGFGVIRCALVEMEMPFTMIEPARWTKTIYQGIDNNLKPKVRAVIAVERLFPGEISKIPAGPISKKLHEGIVDALLIAEYGRRQSLLSS